MYTNVSEKLAAWLKQQEVIVNCSDLYRRNDERRRTTFCALPGLGKTTTADALRYVFAYTPDVVVVDTDTIWQNNCNAPQRNAFVAGAAGQAAWTEALTDFVNARLGDTTRHQFILTNLCLDHVGTLVTYKFPSYNHYCTCDSPTGVCNMHAALHSARADDWHAQYAAYAESSAAKLVLKGSARILHATLLYIVGQIGLDNMTDDLQLRVLNTLASHTMN